MRLWGLVQIRPDHIAEKLGIKESAEALVLTAVTVPPDNPAAGDGNVAELLKDFLAGQGEKR